MVLGGVQGEKRERRSVPKGTVESMNTCHNLHSVTQNDNEKPRSRGLMQEQTLKPLGRGTRRAVQTVSTEGPWVVLDNSEACTSTNSAGSETQT